MISKNTKIYIAGHRGMVESAVWRIIESKGYSNTIGKTTAELDLRNQHYLASLLQDMMQSDVILMKKDQYLREGGYTTLNYFE